MTGLHRHNALRQPYYRDDQITFYRGKALDVARELPSDSVDCIVTSPPYFNLRDYLRIWASFQRPPTPTSLLDEKTRLAGTQLCPAREHLALTGGEARQPDHSRRTRLDAAARTLSWLAVSRCQ